MIGKDKLHVGDPKLQFSRNNQADLRNKSSSRQSFLVTLAPLVRWQSLGSNMRGDNDQDQNHAISDPPPPRQFNQIWFLLRPHRRASSPGMWGVPELKRPGGKTTPTTTLAILEKPMSRFIAFLYGVASY